MSLTSPGVEVSIIDQSQYLPAPSGSVPLIVLATAQNKADASGTAVASATTAANAGKLFQITSQRDLVNLYGTPFFYTTTNGTSIHGYELNEYGLLTAYSILGVTNRCFVLRADVDLAGLVGQTGRPVGNPADETSWLDTAETSWGIYEFNSVTGDFTLQSPLVITNSDYLVNGVPIQSIGNIGDYAVNTLQITSDMAAPIDAAAGQYFYKTNTGWAKIGEEAWLLDIPTVQGTTASVITGSFTISVNGGTAHTVTLTNGQTISQIVTAIDALGITYLTATEVNGKLNLYLSTPVVNPAENTEGYLTLTNSVLAPTLIDVVGSIGLTAGTYYQPSAVFGTSAEMPTWTSGQVAPRPSGSVWIKIGAAGTGLNPVVSRFSALTNLWSAKNVSLHYSDWKAIAALDATGGQRIPAGTVYAQYGFNQEFNQGPVYLWERIATGPTVVTGNDITPTFTGTKTFTVKVSSPTGTLSSAYTVTVPPGGATEFVTAWLGTGIPYTTVGITPAGAIQIVHTEGGVIILDDSNNGTLTAAGFLARDVGLTPSTLGCKLGPYHTESFAAVAVTGGGGTSATLDVTASSVKGVYTVTGLFGGTSYVVGNTLTVAGTLLGGLSPANDLVVKVTAVSTGVITAVQYVSGTPAVKTSVQLSNWVEFAYSSNEGAPVASPANGTNWFHSVTDEVDILVQHAGVWKNYRAVSYDSNGHPVVGTNETDPRGPIIAASAPTMQSLIDGVGGAALEYGDLWVDTSDLENYPKINRWQRVAGVDQWVQIDTTDQVSSRGIVFADARWSTAGTVNPANDPITPIATFLTITPAYLDLDAPQATLYPQGVLLFNTRRSGYTVKQYRTAYFNLTDFPGSSLPDEKAAWVTISGNKTSGAAYMGRKAQRAVVVQAMNAAVASNASIRDEDNGFNLIAAPNYPELQPTLVALNNDRGSTAFIVGDTPLRLPSGATDVQAWATNAAGAAVTGEDGCITRDTYLGLFYPSGITNDLSGNEVVVPASHMMLRTFLRNDTIAYPWLAAAGTRRGTIDNANNIGYLNGSTGEFQTIKTSVGLRDTLYSNAINPLVFFSGLGLLNYGNKASYASSSALDRVNVARLVAYIRRQLTLATRPFVFEPNDALTRNQVSAVVQTLLVDLVAKRGIYDYLVVCDTTNNTPARIDRNELWIDVAIEPVKASEFIYIPVRILNTGELAGTL